eukprot:s901_g11.t3
MWKKHRVGSSDDLDPQESAVVVEIPKAPSCGQLDQEPRARWKLLGAQAGDAPGDHFCTLDDVTLAELTKKSPEEQRRWPMQAGEEQSNGKTSSNANGTGPEAPKVSEPDPVKVDAKIDQESSESENDESRPLGKHEGAVAQIVAREAKEAKDDKAAKNPKNGCKKFQEKLGLWLYSFKSLDCSLKEELQLLSSEPPSDAKVEAIEKATPLNLNSLVERGCRLIAVSVCGDLFRDSPISGIMLRENDTQRPALWISQAWRNCFGFGWFQILPSITIQ